MSTLKGKQILVGISGGIAAYKYHHLFESFDVKGQRSAVS